MMRSLLALSVAVTLATAPASAQARPDFSGIWKVNVSKSDAPPARPGGQAPDMSQISVTITQAADSVVLVQAMGEQSRTVVHYLDGRESTNTTGRGTTKAKSHWEGSALITEGTMTATTPMGEMQMTTKEVRELSADGKTMTVTTTTDSPRGTMTRKTVFDRQ
jgi:arylamine N-acetyltransferase